MRRPLLLAALLLASPALAETIEVRPDLTFQGTTPYLTAVAARVGDTIRVDLPAQAGTGYVWTATLEGDALRPGRSETHAAARPGGPKREIRTYVAGATGSARISFAYRRPWEAAKPPARQVVLNVAVTEAPAADPRAPGQPRQP